MTATSISNLYLVALQSAFGYSTGSKYLLQLRAHAARLKFDLSFLPIRLQESECSSCSNRKSETTGRTTNS